MSEITPARDGLDAAKEQTPQSSEDLLLEAFSPIAEDDIADPALATAPQTLLTAGESDRLHVALGGADRALAWYRARLGSTAYEGWCEKAGSGKARRLSTCFQSKLPSLGAYLRAECSSPGPAPRTRANAKVRPRRQPGLVTLRS